MSYHKLNYTRIYFEKHAKTQFHLLQSHTAHSHSWTMSPINGHHLHSGLVLEEQWENWKNSWRIERVHNLPRCWSFSSALWPALLYRFQLNLSFALCLQDQAKNFVEAFMILRPIFNLVSFTANEILRCQVSCSNECST